jgi:hypothetical protein
MDSAPSNQAEILMSENSPSRLPAGIVHDHTLITFLTSYRLRIWINLIMFYNMVNGRLVPLHACFQVLNGILASEICKAVLNPPRLITKEGFIKCVLSKYEQSHGWTEEVCKAFFQHWKGRRLEFLVMEQACNVKFDNLSQRYKFKEIQICVVGERSSIPESFYTRQPHSLGEEPAHDAVSVISPVTVTEHPTTPVVRPTRATLQTKAKVLFPDTDTEQHQLADLVFTKTQNDKAQREFKNNIEPLLHDMAQEVLNTLEKKRTMEGLLALQVLIVLRIERLVQDIFPKGPREKYRKSC